MSRTHLDKLGVFGFGRLETVILAALVTEDPLLLIGRSGTGKTYLLNSLSEALGLEHRHYNASLVSFDDLVGFPFPDDEKTSVKFLQTPATIWGAESVLVDEISRCRPEHQNRLFSLVHERRIQGLPLTGLRYRWAAMNPCSVDQGGDYAGSEPLDRALADRFGLLVEVSDWESLSDEERLAVADPAGEGAMSDDGGELKAQVEGWRRDFLRLLPTCPKTVLVYASTVTTALNQAGVRISPRRARMLSRSLLAATVVAGKPSDQLFRQVLGCSLPHVAWGETVAPETVVAAHRIGWQSASLEGAEKWVNDFHLERKLAKKVRLLLQSCPDKDAGTLAVSQCLATDDRARAAALAFALYPAALLGHLPIGAEAINDLGKLAKELLRIDSEISWKESYRSSGTAHPEFSRLTPVLHRLRGARRERATQLFYWAIANEVVIHEPEALERDLAECVKILRKVVAS
jgi:MoxR-like ATPase